MYYVYILLLRNSKTYIGFSTDLNKRLNYHQSGKVSSTKNHRPVRLIYYEVYNKKADAQRSEFYYKSGKGRQDLKIKLHNTFKASSSSG